MNYNFDFFGRYEKPMLILCEADDSEIGHIVNPQNLKSSYSRENVSEISYDIYQSDSNSDFYQDIYNKHIERRQVYVSGVGYFIITSVSEVDDNDGRYKQIVAKSCEYELNNISMPYINGTYALYKAENFDGQTNEEIASQGDEYLNSNCILYEIMKCVPSWKLKQLKFVEDEKYNELANTYRTFEYENTSVYSFLKNVVQDKYSCYVSFDIETRTIEILRRDDVFTELPVIISPSNILNECSVSTDIEDCVNSLSVEVVNDVSIAPFNPLGSSTIYNFDNDIKSGLISGDLKDAIEFWVDRINDKDEQTVKVKIPTYTSESFSLWREYDKKVLEFKNKILEKISSDNADGKEGEYSVNYRDILDDLDTYLRSVQVCEEHDQLYIPGGFTEETNEIDLHGALDHGRCDDTDMIERVFFSLFSIKHKLIKPITSYEDVELTTPEANRQLLYMQEYLELVRSELSKEESNRSGYDAQLKALESTIVESDDTVNAKALEYNKRLVSDYILLTNDSIIHYKNIVGSDDIESGYVSGLLGGILTISSAVRNIYSRNSFESTFADFFRDKDKGSELYSILTRYLKQQSYQEDTIVVTDAMGLDEKFDQSKELYDQAVDTLKTISEPNLKLSVKAEAFLFSREFEDAIKNLDMRSAVYVEVPSGDVPLFMIETISVVYDDAECEITFGNRINPSDPLSVFADIQNTAASTANIVASERINWGISSEKINELMSAKSADIDTTYREMTNSINSVNTGSYGFKCFTEDQKYGIWMANGTAMFIESDDSGNQRSKAAIGRIIKSDGSIEYGFYGQSIIANSITADKLAAGSVLKGTNYIKNGSFEQISETISADGSGSKIHTADFWKVEYGSIHKKDSNDVPNDVRAAIGDKCILLDVPSCIFQNISTPLQPGRYMLSCYFKVDDNANIQDRDRNMAISFSYKTLDKETGVYNDDNQISNSLSFEDSHSGWSRVYSTLDIGETKEIQIRICVGSSVEQITGVYVDGIMLEGSEFLNDYTPHISETYAKYTSIDDKGITVYDGKINILNSAGSSVFYADSNGDLTLKGIIEAHGGKIAGWSIDESRLYKDKTGMMSEGDYAFYAGAKTNDGGVTISDPLFSVTNDGYLRSVSGEIGGWIIEDGCLHNQRTGMSSTGELVFYAGAKTHNNGVPDDPMFYVNNNGELRSYTNIDSNRFYIGINGNSIEFSDSDGNFRSGICFASPGSGSIWSKIIGMERGEDIAIVGRKSVILGVEEDDIIKPMFEATLSEGGSTAAGITIENSVSCFQPASDDILGRSYLGSSRRPWTGIWVEGFTGLTQACFTPQVITYQSVGGIYRTATVLALDKIDTIEGTAKKLFGWLKDIFNIDFI